MDLQGWPLLWAKSLKTVKSAYESQTSSVFQTFPVSYTPAYEENNLSEVIAIFSKLFAISFIFFSYVLSFQYELATKRAFIALSSASVAEFLPSPMAFLFSSRRHIRYFLSGCCIYFSINDSSLLNNTCLLS